MKKILHLLIKVLLWLRYRISVEGLDQVRDDGTPILFVPNHPALIDPVIVMSRLYGRFRPRPLADEAQVNRMVIRRLTGMLGTIVIPDLASGGRDNRQKVRDGIDQVVAALNRGEHVLLYPAGRLMRGPREDLGANSAVHEIVRRVDRLRVVMIRTTGLWGSGFSRAHGAPSLVGHLRRCLVWLLANMVVFMPRRPVKIEVQEADRLPVQAGKMAVNRYLEQFYNQVPQPRLEVPLAWWQGPARIVPEPARQQRKIDTSMIPESTRQLVMDRIRQLAGVGEVREDDHLARDLALDSLVLVEFGQTLVEEFGVPADHLDGLETVADCILAAGGIAPDSPSLTLHPPGRGWQEKGEGTPLGFGPGRNVAELFLAQARIYPDRVIVADQISGEKTYRQLGMAVLALLPQVKAIPGERVGIMLPGSVAAVIAYLAVMFAGKEPVMVNWTSGAGQVNWCLKQCGVSQVLSSAAFLGRVRNLGFDPDRIGVRWLTLEEMGSRISLLDKVRAAAHARCGMAPLRRARIADTAAILFTSGSEARPKAVPLSHANFLANGRDFGQVLALTDQDRLLGILPVFHSLGLAGTVILPLCTGLRTVYWPNPTEGLALARMADLYRITILITTPTFLRSMLDRVEGDELRDLRLVFAGAEKCPLTLFEKLAAKAPNAVLCEGYGVTECSPVITVNRPDRLRPGTIGQLLPSLDAVLLHPEKDAPVDGSTPGRLLVRGPSVFSGYLGEATSPFVEHNGHQWYDTGDLMIRDQDGVFRFAGRLKRFVKLGGEMISLPAIEEVLMASSGIADSENGLAVLARGEEQPELVLACTGELSRERVNRVITDAGLSPLHKIRQVVRIRELPLLGSGKIDYPRLQRMISKEEDR